MSITKISPSVVDFDAGITISTTDNSDNLTLTSTDADANVGPAINLYRNSGTPADNDFLGNIKFNGRNDNTQDVQYAEVEAYILDASDGTEDGLYNINVMTAGTNTSYMQLKAGSGVVFNEDSNDLDFRIEGNGQANLFVVNGGTDDIGIGMSDPTFATGNGMQFADNFYLGFGTGNGTRPDFTIHGDNNGLEIACGTGADTADITIDTEGRVGISNTSPQAELHIKDASAGSRIIVEAPASGQDADIQFKTADDGQGWVTFHNGTDNKGAIKYNHASDYMSFRTNGTDNRLYIDSGGKVNVGMTGGAGVLSVAGMLHMYTLTGAAQASDSVTLSLTQSAHAGGSSKQGSMMLFIGGYGNSLTGHVRAVYQIAGLMFFDHASTSTITQISQSTDQCSLSVTRNGTGYDITLTNSNAAQTKSLAVTALLCAY